MDRQVCAGNTILAEPAMETTCTTHNAAIHRCLRLYQYLKRTLHMLTCSPCCSPLLQVCSKVPVPKTKQVCNRICTKTTTMTEQIATEPTVVGGKGKAMLSW